MSEAQRDMATKNGGRRNRYAEIIGDLFVSKYKPGATEVPFERKEIIEKAAELGVDLPLNLGDVVYSFRYRTPLPVEIRDAAPAGKEWVIRPIGHAKYSFSLTDIARFIPNMQLAETKIPDATPGIITRYAMDDEQGLLAKIRYNRLIDIFTGVTCHSLQNHLRTTVQNMGQVETDEIYVGVDRRGVHYIFPVQAKGGSDQLGIVQIEQDFALCREKFPELVAMPIATQFVDSALIAMFSFEQDAQGKVRIAAERHYRLVEPHGVTAEDLHRYMARPMD